MIQLHTYPQNVNTRIVSSMRAALNSQYCMRARVRVRSPMNGQVHEQSNGEYFFYQEGQHGVVSNGSKTVHDNGKLRLPEEIKITKTRHGKRWRTYSMEVELAKDILEVRDGLGTVVDEIVLKDPLPEMSRD